MSQDPVEALLLGRHDRLVQYVSVGKLRGLNVLGLLWMYRPKGAEEGFEARLTWPHLSLAQVAALSPLQTNDCSIDRILAAGVL